MDNNELIVDDDGLRQLLKLPEEADLRYYRDRACLPYTGFKQDGKMLYRYLTSEVLQWVKKRLRHRIEE